MISLLLHAALAARPDVAVLMSEEREAYTAPVPSFTDSIGVPVQVANIEGRWSRAVMEIDRLRRTDPEVVVAIGSKAAWAVHTEMPNTPMVYASVLEPERYGLVGNQVTGIAAVIPPVTYLSQVTAWFPAVTTVGVIRSTELSDDEEAELISAGRAVGLGVEVRRVSTPREFRAAFNELARTQDAVWLSAQREVLSRQAFRAAVVEMQRRQKPLLADTKNMVAAGAAFAVVPDPVGLGQQVAEIAARILDGASPAVIPVADPLALSTVVNRGTLVGAEVPFESLMLDFAEVVD